MGETGYQIHNFSTKQSWICEGFYIMYLI